MTLVRNKPDNDGGSPITGYEYLHSRRGRTRYQKAGSISRHAPGETNDLSYTVGGLINETTHSFVLREENAVGRGNTTNLYAYKEPGAVACGACDPQRVPLSRQPDSGGG